MNYKGSKLHVMPWGLRITYPHPFVAAVIPVVRADDPNKTAEYGLEDASGFTLFVYDSNKKSVGGLASYTATDGV